MHSSYIFLCSACLSPHSLPIPPVPAQTQPSPKPCWISPTPDDISLHQILLQVWSFPYSRTYIHCLNPGLPFFFKILGWLDEQKYYFYGMKLSPPHATPAKTPGLFCPSDFYLNVTFFAPPSLTTVFKVASPLGRPSNPSSRLLGTWQLETDELLFSRSSWERTYFLGRQLHSLHSLILFIVQYQSVLGIVWWLHISVHDLHFNLKGKNLLGSFSGNFLF